MALQETATHGLPPPKLRDLAAWIQKENCSNENSSIEVWEIGVPKKHSLYWSILLSALFIEKDKNILPALETLTGDASEMEEIKRKKNLKKGKINPVVITKNLNKFNPFKNRHNFFHWPEFIELFRIFKLRLNRRANELTSKEIKFNDEFKLEVAASLFACEIKIYFPESRKFLLYPKAAHKFEKSIVLFQYENQMHGGQTTFKNIFNFAMTVQQAHELKLDALGHFLKKAKIPVQTIRKVKQLMKSPEVHGKAFLPTVLKSNCLDVLTEIYRSPYIAFKLSEAGFDTDPVAQLTGKPSPLCYALCIMNPKYHRILYDYASNCRCLFDKTVRRADDTVLENLERIKRTIERDISIVNNKILTEHITGRALPMLKQLYRFVEYQLETASDLRNIRIKYEHRAESGEFLFRKEIILSILEHYLTYFHYESPKAGKVPQQLADYLKFTEYYEYTDNFFFASFFDNFYKLKLCSGLRDERMYLNVEWIMFLAMLSSKYFPITTPKIELEDECKKTKCEKNKNLLRRIPLFYRNAVENEVEAFLLKLKNCSSSQDLMKCFEKEKLDKESQTLEIIDELMISELKKYIEAALEASPTDDGMRAILAIERAMQVIGESIKPPSVTNSVVSFLLKSCLSQNLQHQLIKIRNDLSHYRSNSTHGKLKVENDVKIFEEIKLELKSIHKAFEGAYFTQQFRIEESVMSNCFNEFQNDLKSDEFKSEYEFRLSQRKHQYEKYHLECINLLLNMSSDLRNYLNCATEKKIILCQLKSIEYLLSFILRNQPEKYLEDFSSEVEKFIKKNKNKSPNDLGCNFDRTLEKFIEEILKNYPQNNTVLSAPRIETFFETYLKENMFSDKEIEEVNKAVRNALKEAKDAKCKLEGMFRKGDYKSKETVEELLNIVIPDDKVDELKNCYDNNDSKLALKYLNKGVSEDSILKNVTKMLEEDSLSSGYDYTLLIKITFQKNFTSKFYASASFLPKSICEKLEFFLTMKAHLVIRRLKALCEILIEEDEEIFTTWKWGRSEAIKYHMKFLMRKRYSREMAVRASLDMAFLDCVNIFHEKTKHGESTTGISGTFYEKSTRLFEGIDMRNLMSHRSSIPETIGGILDEDDFPSEMIDKMLQLIDDTAAIEALLEVFRVRGILEENDFVKGIESEKFTEHMKLMKDIGECTRWKAYLSLLPFIKTKKSWKR